MRKRHARAPGRDKNFVGVTQKIFSVLEALSQQPKSGLPLDEITEITGMAKTTVHRLLYSMGKLGYIEQDPVTNLYSLSGKFFELGTNALPYQRLTVLAKPLMQSLLLTFGESVNLAVPMSGLAIYILVLESPKPHRVAAAVGNYSYFHCTSVGKSIAAFLSPEELEQSLIRYGLPAMTPSSITTRSRLEEELEKVRAEGVAVDNTKRTRKGSFASAVRFLRAKADPSLPSASPALAFGSLRTCPPLRRPSARPFRRYRSCSDTHLLPIRNRKVRDRRP